MEATMDTSAVDNANTAEDVQQPTATDFHSTEEAQTDAHRETDQPVDGRVGTKDHRDVAKALTESHPEHARALSEMASNSFRLRAYQQTFAKPEDATAAKQLLDSAGGLDGLTKMRDRVEAFDSQDAMLRDGNPQALDAFFQDFPEGAAAIAPHYLERLESTNPEAFKTAIAPHAFGLLEKAGVANHLHAILQESDSGRKEALIKQLAAWYTSERKAAAQSLQDKPKGSPQDDKLKAREKELNEREESMFQSQVAGRVNAKFAPEMDKQLTAYARDYKLNQKQQDHLRAQVQQRLVAEMNGDERYKGQLRLQNGKNRTVDGVGDYVASEVLRRLPDTAFTVASEVFGASKRPSAQATSGVVRPNNPKTAPNGGPLYVSQRPQDSELDLSRKDAEMMLIQGRGYRRSDGMFVSWRK